MKKIYKKPFTRSVILNTESLIATSPGATPGINTDSGEVIEGEDIELTRQQSIWDYWRN